MKNRFIDCPVIISFFTLNHEQMWSKIVKLLLPCLFFMHTAHATKAYEAIAYTGKTQDMLIRFTLADGYIGACEIETQHYKTGKKSKFLPEAGVPDDHFQITFYHYSKIDGKTFGDYFIMDNMQDAYEPAAPAVLTGYYYLNGISTKIVLHKNTVPGRKKK